MFAWFCKDAAVVNIGIIGKFDRVISITCSDVSYLSVYMGVRGHISGLTCIPTRNGSITDYEVGISCMDMYGHGIKQ